VEHAARIREKISIGMDTASEIPTVRPGRRWKNKSKTDHILITFYVGSDVLAAVAVI
jgi:hypothetical protein